MSTPSSLQRTTTDTGTLEWSIETRIQFKGRESLIKVILNTEDYITEAMRQLSNTEYYRKVAKDFTPDHENQINQCINELE